MNKKFLISCVGCAFLCLGMGQGVNKTFDTPTVSTMKEFLAEENHVKLSVKALNEEESKKYLKKDLLEIGYQPVEVTVENGSSDPYLLSKDSVGLPTVEGKEIAKSVLKAAMPRSIAFKIAGFFFWPVSIPSTIDGVLTNKSYRKLKKELTSKAVREETIAPYSTVHRVFFVKKEDYQTSFEVTLENQENLESKVFRIEGLVQQESQTIEALPVVVENYYINHES